MCEYHAQRGNAEAMYTLGKAYVRGEGTISKDWKKAILWLDRAASLPPVVPNTDIKQVGVVESQLLLGQVYLSAIGVWFSKSDAFTHLLF